MKTLLLFAVLCFCIAFTTSAQGKDEQLYIAVQKNDKAKVEALLQKKADANYVKQAGPWMKVSPLITAVNNDNPEIVKLLIENGAKVDWKDGFNTTALMYAASKGNKDIVELLLANGADVNATDGQGKDVLSAAMDSENDEIIALIESKIKQ